MKDLDGKALVPRRDGVRWKDCIRGGERRLVVGQAVMCVAANGRHVCVGHMDGSMKAAVALKDDGGCDLKAPLTLGRCAPAGPRTVTRT